MNSPSFEPLLPAVAASAGRRDRAAWRTVLLAGCAAATIDILFAFAFFGWQLGITPLRVLQSVASGLFGPASFRGGWATGAAGLLAHYCILIVAAGCYYLASLRVAFLNRHAVAAGLAFGIAIYLAMTFVIVPLSAAPMRPPALNVVSAGQFLIHPLIGLAIALLVRGARRSG